MNIVFCDDCIRIGEYSIYKYKTDSSDYWQVKTLNTVFWSYSLRECVKWCEDKYKEQ